MSDVMPPRNLPSARALNIGIRIGLTGHIVTLLGIAIALIVTLEPSLQGTVASRTVGVLYLGLFVIALAFAALGLQSGHLLDKYYQRVSDGIISGFGESRNGHPYIVLAGLNGVGVPTEQRVYIRGAVKWRSLNIGDSYTQD